MFFVFFFFFFFSSRRRHTRCREVSWARRCVQETVIDASKIWVSFQLIVILPHVHLKIVQFSFELIEILLYSGLVAFQLSNLLLQSGVLGFLVGEMSLHFVIELEELAVELVNTFLFHFLQPMVLFFLVHSNI
eukprot:TRINITY_DN4742_c0_g1_i5.p2 TRINITY_DN4742_c0_g1~~TRINITY_DN4742_c0_g1_i5.p2  ORF type:complete len:133 (-),score=39.12 TRINITY_DN4742_c0_g1_i5:185-583(-)